MARPIAPSLLGLVCLLWSAVSSAQSNPVLSRAKQELINQHHAKVIELVRPLVEPRSVLASEADEVSAYEMLAVSYWWLKKYKASESAFMILLNMRPSYRLNPAIHPAGLVRFFERVRKKLRLKPVEIRQRQRQELSICRQKLQATRKDIRRLSHRCGVEKILEKRRLWPAFVPFGIGQFNNGDDTKGWIFFSAELALLLINAGSYIVAETSWVRNGPSGTVRNDEQSIKRAKSVQAAQIASGVLLGATALAGIIEALVSYKGTKIRVKPLHLNVKTGKLTLGVTPTGTVGLSWDME